MADEKEKKQRVIHTRVSETLDEELREKAEALGVSVSNLVRNVLSNALGLVDKIVDDAQSVVGSVGGAASARAARPAAQPGGEVLAWQTAVLNLNALCTTCNAILPKGTEAALGITRDPSAKPIMCITCLEELRNDEPKSPSEPASKPVED